MSIIVRKSGEELVVINGHRRLETQLELIGEATVELEGEQITVVKNDDGQLVEKVVQSNKKMDIGRCLKK